MGKLRLVIAAFFLAALPLVWASTIAPSAQPIHTHDQSGNERTILTKTISVPIAEATFGEVRATGETLTPMFCCASSFVYPAVTCTQSAGRWTTAA